ncbi:SLAC1 anion channel family protein [Enterobacter bugandensis]|uniref:SLAC1 anion channel family protein n=1 Tax=Enterobacter TaxID=547 RepID=UPI00124AB0AA|nr:MULTISPECIES: SLAC1 anion channel family protein [Enterobacter]HBU6133629.1 SLAC1 anion channel family protein [Enterobacter cloacae]MBF2750893.1 SLAC1 anion channel family protein [Enterobacter bugandensis]MBF2803482.1 SLAC1 anion channel family protein [Enterobacter bugandensis]MCP1116248.1 SLAC1 anion channel family protein [Enterobacter bugandensis]MDO2434274.1 SLAC1 anion channel family protein [Enterobacter bugandensis]
MNSAYTPTVGASQLEKNSTTSIKNLPVNLFGSVMGLAGLALAWRLSGQYYGIGGVFGEAIGALAGMVFVLLTLGYLIKWAKHPGVVKAEFNHPISSNFFGTVTIALLLLSAVAAPHNKLLGQGLWILGSALTVLLAGLVVSRMLSGNQDPLNAVPAWLIPGVATLDIAVTGEHIQMIWAAEFNLFALAVGAVLAMVFFTRIFQRLVHETMLAKGMMPSLMVLIAPFEVGFLAYTSVFGETDRFASVLFYFGLFLFVILSFKIFRRDVPFSPSWWAISFPVAALSNAALKYAHARENTVLMAIAAVILLLLTAALTVLLVKTLISLFSGKLLTD